MTSITDALLLTFIGILVSDLLYQSNIITKIYKKIYKIELDINLLKEKVNIK
ncbi:MAG: hypothetical protein QXE05_10845 [Nitrososphaeria archaeon]|nr:hypothetical protein [Candidatus Jingweiarchaeum tengchongense]